MKRLTAPVWLSLIVLASGCGSNNPPAMTLSCTTQALSSGLIRVNATVYNATNLTRSGLVYGPALAGTRFVHPVLNSAEVTLDVNGAKQIYPGWIVPSVSTQKPAHITFRVVKPTHPASVLIQEEATRAKGGNITVSVSGDSSQILNNPDCTVK